MGLKRRDNKDEIKRICKEKYTKLWQKETGVTFIEWGFKVLSSAGETRWDVCVCAINRVRMSGISLKKWRKPTIFSRTSQVKLNCHWTLIKRNGNIESGQTIEAPNWSFWLIHSSFALLFWLLSDWLCSLRQTKQRQSMSQSHRKEHSQILVTCLRKST